MNNRPLIAAHMGVVQCGYIVGNTAEVCFKTESSRLASSGFINEMHEHGRKLWLNAIIFDHNTLKAIWSDNYSCSPAYLTASMVISSN